MSVTPNEIRNAQFSTTMRGYSRDDVDTFLQKTADALESALAQLAEINAAHESLQANHHKLAELEETLKSTLVDARQTANTIVDTAKSDAQRIITEAHDKARQVHARELDKAGQITQQVERVTEIRDSYRRRVEELISNHLTLIGELDNVQPDMRDLEVIDELADTADLSTYIPVDEEDTGEVEDSHSADTPERRLSLETPNEPTSSPTAETESGRTEAPESTHSDASPDKSVTASVMELSAERLAEAHPDCKSVYEKRLVEDIVEITEVPSDQRPPVSVQIARAADRAVSEGKLVEIPQPSEEREVDKELYKKLRKTDELASPDVPRQIKSRQKSTREGNSDPTKDLRGEDGIIVFGRREDRERAVEENAKVLSDLDSVVDKFAEELSKMEKS